eukprot:111800_1
MANIIALLCIYCITYISFMTSVHSLIIWELDLSQYCNASFSWSCSSTNVNKNTYCNNIDCVRLRQNAFIEIGNINTTNNYDLHLNYTLWISAFDATDSFDIFVISDTETIKLTHISSTENEELPVTTFSVPLNASIDNQASITIRFKISGSGAGDIAYILDALLYNNDTYSPTILPTMEPVYEPTLEPTILTDSGDESKIAFGTEYKDRYMLILAGSMFTGAVLIIVYFRCCKKRRDEKKKLKEAMENEKELVEMQQVLNKDDVGVIDELVNKDDGNVKETKGKNEGKNSKKDKIKSDNGKGKTEKRNDKYDIKVDSASPTSIVSVDMGAGVDSDGNV